MELTDVRRCVDVWPFVVEQFTDAGFDTELVHGLRHIRRVRDERHTLFELCPGIGEKVFSLLGVAVDVHDLGRIHAGNHAKISAELFAQMPIEDLDEDEKEAIIFAVGNHNRGLEGVGVDRAETLREKLLGLLCLCDHADAASTEGYVRAAIWRRTLQPELPILSSFSVDHLRELMAEGCPIEKMGEYKSESLVAHLAYNFYATEPILQRVRHLLSDDYLGRVAVRQQLFGELIEVLFELQNNS